MKTVFPTNMINPPTNEGIAILGKTSLRYRQREGKGETIVFLHSLGCNLNTWSGVEKRCNPEYATLTYDLRGHGESFSEYEVQTIDDHVFDLLDLLDNLEIEKVTLSGLSIGGLIALATALSHPERVNKLVLTATNSRIGNIKTWNQRIRLISNTSLAEQSEILANRWFSESFIKQSPEVVQSYVTQLKTSSQSGYCSSCAVLRDTNLSKQLRQLEIPTLVIGGEQDRAVRWDDIHELSSSIPGSQLVCIEKAGHFPVVEQPDNTSNAILTFLRAYS